MSMQKYRADVSSEQHDGATLWHAKWMGGLTLSKIVNCRVHSHPDLRLTVYITGEPDTYFSQPAATRRRGKYVSGYVTGDYGGYIFHAMDKHKARLD